MSSLRIWPAGKPERATSTHALSTLAKLPFVRLRGCVEGGRGRDRQGGRGEKELQQRGDLCFLKYIIRDIGEGLG